MLTYSNVCLESFGYEIPPEIVTSEEIERRLKPLYTRLRLPAGRLELMSGIRERRFWPEGAVLSDASIRSCRAALNHAEIATEQVGALIHASVCRDHLEPATACRVHHELGLRSDCIVYDVSNACLGILNGMLQVANMIELGQIGAGLVVGTESGRQLVENTIDTLNGDERLTRQQIKSAVASLTIGSGSCAVLLTSREISRTQNSILASAVRANSTHHGLCQSGADEAGSAMRPLMATDSEALMREGIATGVTTFEALLQQSGWSRDSLKKTICHQVGSAHHKLMFEKLGLDASIDFATLQWLGNTGSVALPITMALAADRGWFVPGDTIGLLGIGSGINCVMMGVDWQQTAATNSQGPHFSSSRVQQGAE